MVLSYAQLKGKIKVGDRVKAVVGKSNPCSELDGSELQLITRVGTQDFAIHHCNHPYSDDYFLDLIGYQKTLDDLEPGDKFRDVRDGQIRTVVDVSRNGYVVFTTDWYNEGSTPSGLNLHSIEGVKRNVEHGPWKLIQPEAAEEVQEMTVEEVSKLVGKTVKIVEKK